MAFDSIHLSGTDPMLWDGIYVVGVASTKVRWIWQWIVAEGMQCLLLPGICSIKSGGTSHHYKRIGNHHHPT